MDPSWWVLLRGDLINAALLVAAQSKAGSAYTSPGSFALGEGTRAHRCELVQGVHPRGVALPDRAESPLLTALPGEEMGKGFVQPLLGFLHSCGTKGIFLVLMTPLTILFPSHALLPTLVTASISPLPAAAFALPSLVFRGSISAQRKRKREAEPGAKLRGQGLMGSLRVSSLCFAFHKVFTGAVQGCSGWQEVLRDPACAVTCAGIRADLIRMMQKPPCIPPSSLAVLLSSFYFFFFVQT